MNDNYHAVLSALHVPRRKDPPRFDGDINRRAEEQDRLPTADAARWDSYVVLIPALDEHAFKVASQSFYVLWRLIVPVEKRPYQDGQGGWTGARRHRR